MTKPQSQEITDVLTPEGIDKLKKGQILGFMHEGSRNDLRITKINKKSHRAWAIPVKTYDMEDMKKWADDLEDKT